MTEPSYHDLYVTTAEIQRVRIHDLPANYMVTCHRAAGWELRHYSSSPHLQSTVIAGEYDDAWLVLDVAGHVICDGRRAHI